MKKYFPIQLGWCFAIVVMSFAAVVIEDLNNRKTIWSGLAKVSGADQNNNGVVVTMFGSNGMKFTVIEKSTIMDVVNHQKTFYCVVNEDHEGKCTPK